MNKPYGSMKGKGMGHESMKGNGFTHATGLQDVQNGHGYPKAHEALESYRHKMDSKVGKMHKMEMGYHKD